MFPTNEEVLDFYIAEYIKRHGGIEFEEKIKLYYFYRPAVMLNILITDYLSYKKFDGGLINEINFRN
jgi:hypothetical protein